MLLITLNLESAVPFLISGTILANGTDLSLQFSEAVQIGAGGNGGFTIALSGGAATLTYDSGDGSSNLIYTISRTVQVAETGTLSYTQPTNGIEDLEGTDLESFSDFDLINAGASFVTVTDYLAAQLGDLYQVNDMWMAYLASLGFTTGSLNDRMMLWLADEGYPGALPDKYSAWVRATLAPHV